MAFHAPCCVMVRARPLVAAGRERIVHPLPCFARDGSNGPSRAITGVVGRVLRYRDVNRRCGEIAALCGEGVPMQGKGVRPLCAVCPCHGGVASAPCVRCIGALAAARKAERARALTFCRVAVGISALCPRSPCRGGPGASPWGAGRLPSCRWIVAYAALRCSRRDSSKEGQLHAGVAGSVWRGGWR